MITSSATEVISAIVTPAILILACSSLIAATANRQSRLLERVRDLTNEIDELREKETLGDKRDFFVAQLLKAARRTKFIQQAMLYLYLSLAALILTSVAVGIISAAGVINTYISLTTIFISLSFLFYASFLLIRESRIALKAVNDEMDYVKRLT